jgi:uncharacterized membrane protein YqgA involved in biofilm formation
MAAALAVITLVIGGVVGYLIGFENRPLPRPAEGIAQWIVIIRAFNTE